MNEKEEDHEESADTSQEQDSDDDAKKCYHVETNNREGEVCVINERCKGCGFCIEFCPVDALEYSDKATEKGYTPPEMTEGCVLCGKCERICPEFAIYLDEEDEEDEKKEGDKEERGDWI